MYDFWTRKECSDHYTRFPVGNFAGSFSIFFFPIDFKCDFSPKKKKLTKQKKKCMSKTRKLQKFVIVFLQRFENKMFLYKSLGNHSEYVTLHYIYIRKNTYKYFYRIEISFNSGLFIAIIELYK